MEEKIKELKNQIVILKLYLHNTDYQAIKFAEGELTEYEYAETKENRLAWRAEINRLEKEIEELKK